MARYLLVTHDKWIREKIEDYSQRFGIRIFELAISPDHIHFAIQIPSREHYKQFIRALTGVIARKMGKGMWSLLPYTRIASWGKPFEILKNYIIQNREETLMLRPYKRRGKERGYFTPAGLSPHAFSAYFTLPRHSLRLA